MMIKMLYGFDLKPWVHYVPIRSDLSDFVNMTSLVLAHRDSDVSQLAQIASSASEYAAMYTYDAVIDMVVEQLNRLWSELRTVYLRETRGDRTISSFFYSVLRLMICFARKSI